MDRPLCFLAVMLQRSPDVRGASNVRARIKQRLKEWTEGKFQMLVSSAEMCAKCFMNRRRGVSTTNERAKVFSNLACRGKLRAVIRCICDTEKGGVLMPDDVDDKSGEKVRDVLHSKHPESRSAPLSDVPEYDTRPETLEILVTDENVETVAKSMSGFVGPDGVDSLAMSGMLLKHGGGELRVKKDIGQIRNVAEQRVPSMGGLQSSHMGEID